ERVAKISNTHQTANHNDKADDRRESDGAAAPSRVYSRLKNSKVKHPRDDGENLEWTGLPVDVVSRVRIPDSAYDTESHQHKSYRHGFRAYRVTCIERRQFIKDRAEPFELQLTLLNDVHNSRAKGDE